MAHLRPARPPRRDGQSCVRGAEGLADPGSATCEMQRHAQVVVGVCVVAERAAGSEAGGLVEAAGRPEGITRAGLETDAGVAAPPRLAEQSIEQNAPDTAPASLDCSVHRLDLTVAGVQLLQPTDT